ncbi:MAG: hypothetical protein JXX29_13245 [Deltaproteobacteria bacterium]|nr:hypothetical protein [Deltaproteobacteria bacterium]MBN2672644.1 hypothetical protein [Deltaproteobacteria bacterium]
MNSTDNVDTVSDILNKTDSSTDDSFETDTLSYEGTDSDSGDTDSLLPNILSGGFNFYVTEYANTFEPDGSIENAVFVELAAQRIYRVQLDSDGSAELWRSDYSKEDVFRKFIEEEEDEPFLFQYDLNAGGCGRQPLYS